MVTQGQRVAAAGAALAIAEPIFALAHMGAVGAIVGGGIGAFVYAALEDLETQTGRGLPSLPVSTPAFMKRKEGQPSIWYRLAVPKSARPPHMGGTQPLDEPPDDELVPEPGTEQALTDAEASTRPGQEGLTHYVTDDPQFALYLGANFAPDVNLVLQEGIFCSGTKGSGKTGVLARISEQISRFPGAAQVVFDKEGDLQSLVTVWPNGRIADAEHWYTAQEIIDQQLRVVVNLQSWLSAEEQAQVIIALVNDLVEYASSQRPADRIPCPVFLDEAQYWLPEKRVAYLAQETQMRLSDAFNILLNTGRKRGLSPFLFTQRIAQVQKSAISCGIQIFMRVVIDNDQARCTEYVRSSVLKKEQFPALGTGQGVVCLPGGVQLLVQFDERKSLHVSHAPKVASPEAAQPTRRLPETPQAPRVIPEQRAYLPPQPAATRRLPEPEPIQMPVTQSRPSPALPPRLQKALDAYRAGNTSSRTLGEALGFKKDVGADLIRQLRERRLID